MNESTDSFRRWRLIPQVNTTCFQNTNSSMLFVWVVRVCVVVFFFQIHTYSTAGRRFISFIISFYLIFSCSLSLLLVYFFRLIRISFIVSSLYTFTQNCKINCRFSVSHMYILFIWWSTFRAVCIRRVCEYMALYTILYTIQETYTYERAHTHTEKETADTLYNQ